MYTRHDELRNEFAHLCSALGRYVEFEQGPANAPLRRADALLRGTGATSAVDFFIVHARQPSTELADAQPGKVAHQTGHRKTREIGTRPARMVLRTIRGFEAVGA